MPTIRLTEVSLTYPSGHRAIEAVSLEVISGEHFVILGPSGAGKSTLLRLMAGLERPDSGTIAFDGRSMEGVPPHERDLAYLSQRPALYPGRTVRSNIAVGLELAEKRRPKRHRLAATEVKARVEEAAQVLGISDLLERSIGEISGGEQRRVTLARAVARRARLWLLDEPFSGVDPVMVGKLSHDLHLIQGQFGLTIVHVTHDPIDAMALADRVGMLGGGQLLQVGKPSEVYARPSSRTVGLHLGRPLINLIDGVGDGKTFIADDRKIRLPCKHVGRLTLGARPEDLRTREFAGAHLLGRWSDSDRRSLGGRWQVVVGPWTIVTGEDPGPIDGAWIDLAKIHWFSADTGDRV